MGTILCIATLDTKGREAQYIKELIEKRGHTALVMDIGSLERSPFTSDITAEEIARAAGSTIQEVSGIDEAGPAAEVMTSGAIKIAKDLYHSGNFQGVISIGGGMGTAVASAVMRELPIGVPKFMLSSQKIVQAGIRGYVVTKDIAIMPSVADIAGLNMLTRKALSNAAGAIIGMVESPTIDVSEKPLVFMTMLGTTTKCGLKVQASLEDKGFEVVIFHSIGVGGMTLEELLKTYPVRGVIELGMNEIGNELFGGMATAGAKRLEAAGARGIAQIVTPGNADFINFLGLETVPVKYRSRNLHLHNPQSTLVRLSAGELKLVGKIVGKKLSKARGPVKVLIPTRGFSSLDREGGVFFDPEANKSFIDSLIGSVSKMVSIQKVDAHINDKAFARVICDELLNAIEPADRP